MNRSRLGEFEMLVVAGVMRLGDEAYGVRIMEVIEDRTDRSVSVGTLYKTLRRLEDKGMLSSRRGESTPVRGGRAKVHYQVEAPGREALSRSLAELDRMVRGLGLQPGEA